MNSDDFAKKVGSFEGAVAWVRNGLEMTRKIRPSLFEPDGLERAHDLEHGQYALTNDDTSMVSRAGSEYRVYRALSLGCAAYVRDGIPLPNWARQWLADHLEGRIVCPSRKRGAPSMKGLHPFICQRIEDLEKAGWSTSRNDETQTICACDVLAEALAQAGLNPTTFEGVKHVWVNWVKECHGNEKDLMKKIRKSSG